MGAKLFRQVARYFHVVAVARHFTIAQARGFGDGERAGEGDGAEGFGAEDERRDEEAGLVHQPRAQEGTGHARTALDDETLNLPAAYLSDHAREVAPARSRS